MEIFSEHFNKHNFLSTVDARVKLGVSAVLLVMVLSYDGVSFPLMVAGVCFSICMMMRIPFRLMLLRMAHPLLIASVVLALKFFFSGEEPLFSVSLFGLQMSGYRDGLVEGLQIMGRILGGVSLLVVLGFSTSFSEFMAGLSWFRIPRQFIEVMMFAYRYLFVFLDDGHTIYNAQKNRLGYSGMRRSMKSFGTLTGALVLRSFEQSQKTSEAMMQRGYTGDLPLLKNRPLKSAEITAGIVCIIVAGYVWMIQ